MPLRLDADSEKALALAKRSVPEDGVLDAGLLMAALYHGTPLRKRLPKGLASALVKPKPLRESADGKVDVARPLQDVLARAARGDEPVTAERLLRALVLSDAGRRVLTSNGLGDDVIQAVLATLGAEPEERPDAESRPGRREASGWVASRERAEAVKALGAWGRMLTVSALPSKGMVGIEKALTDLTTTLLKMGKHNAVVHGPPGCGKTAVVYELARLLAEEDPSVPDQIADYDIFELSPSFLKAGAGVVGEYEGRVSALIKVLEAHPKIILFVDELHSLFQSGVQFQGPFTQANEAFKVALGKGRIACIGCTTTAEYRHFIEPDGALARRFDEIKLEAPTPDATLKILEARLPRLQQHFATLTIPPAMLERTVALTEDYLPSLYQPAKSIQLIDRACAMCITAKPRLPELTEDLLFRALEATIGRSLIRPGDLTEDDVFERITAKIVGQDEVIRELASAFVGGMGSWKASKGPRGRWLFAGPTGVGKTETARALAQILGGGEREALLRIDCNTLQGSGHDSGPAQTTLLGAPPGYRDHGPGLLSKIRDVPECIVLFDEIEKADPGVGKIILQVLHEGQVRDATEAVLDFRRAFVVFTTNAGSIYESSRGRLGFEPGDATADAGTPSVDKEAVFSELRQRGLGEEFLGRHIRFFGFQGLGMDAAQVIIGKQLQSLRETAEERGYELDWAPEIVTYLAGQWQPRFGVRHLTTILRHRIEEHLAIADAQGELRGIRRIRLEPLGDEPSPEHAGLATRTRSDETLIITLA
jgi:ATP-dependent Clp protease ATP-binding subunit ClpA